MATEFEQLLKEQKLTNKLIAEQTAADAKAPTLVRSFRDSLGEILDNRRTAKKYAEEDKKFQKKEGIVKVDENVASGTKEVIKQSDFFKEQIQSLSGTEEDIASDFKLSYLLDIKMERLINLTKDIFKVMYPQEAAMREFTTVQTELSKKEMLSQPSPSQVKATQKKTTSNEEEKKGFFKTLVEQGKGLNDFLKNNKFAQGAKSFLGKALLITGLFAFLKFISSPKFIKFAAFLDKTIVPVLGKIFDVLMSVGKKALDVVGKLGGIILDPDAGMMAKVGASLGLLVIGGIALFSKSILGFIGGLGVAGLSKVLGGAVGKTVLLPILKIFGPLILAIGSAAAGLIEGFKTFEAARAEGDNVFLALTKGIGGFIAGFFGFLPDLLVKGIGKFVGLFDEELGKKIEAFSFTKIIKDVLGTIGGVVKDLFIGLFSGIRKLLMGKTKEDLQEELERDRAMQERLEKQIEDFKGNRNTRKFQRLENKLKGAEGRIVKAEGELKRMEVEGTTTTGGLFGTMSEVDTVSGQGGKTRLDRKKAQGKYTGGSAMAGQSILVGEAGPEFFIPTTDAQIFSARRTEEMIMSALARGMSGGGEGGSTIITSDNSVRSNSSTTNVVNETITPLDTITTSVISSV